MSAVQSKLLSTWLLDEAWQLDSPSKLTRALVDQLLSVGVPLHRLRITLRILHPQVTGFSYTWMARDNEIEEFQSPHEMMLTEAYRDSPYWAIFEEGAGAIRRRLSGPDAQLDYPLLEQLAEDGCSDYVALPIVFMDGSIHAITIAAGSGGGFTTDQLSAIYEMLPALSRLMEIHALRSTSRVLLETYLGSKTGQQVLQGKIRRGDGELIEAVIWFCDLRNSTVLAEQMGIDAFIDHLNCFLEVMADSVAEEGGEVLRYIGDAMLAIFPIGSRECSKNGSVAAKSAFKAAQKSISRMNTSGGERQSFGIALHAGIVMYGNIGSTSRLEFTVIGAAANEAARIEALTKNLNVPLLMSQEFVDLLGGNCESADSFGSVGNFELKGVKGKKQLYTSPVLRQ